MSVLYGRAALARVFLFLFHLVASPPSGRKRGAGASFCVCVVVEVPSKTAIHVVVWYMLSYCVYSALLSKWRLDKKPSP